MLKVKEYIIAMPLVAVGLSMLAGEVVKPGMRIRDAFDRLRGGY